MEEVENPQVNRLQLIGAMPLSQTDVLTNHKSSVVTTDVGLHLSNFIQINLFLTRSQEHFHEKFGV